MRFAILQEADFEPGKERERYKEMIEEAVLAEEMGFDVYGLSEQHFNTTVATISAPEVLFGFVAARTSRIRLRWTSAVLLNFNHPIRVAERLATLDVISDGRAELGTARSNNPYTLEAFGVDAKTTRQQWRESLEIIAKAMSEDMLEHHGRLWDIPSRLITPRPIQKPHPPFLVAATGLETHRIAGQMGIGVMCGNSLPGGWDYVAECARTYKEAVAGARPFAGAINNCASCFAATVHCAATTGKARKEAAVAAFRFVDLMIDWYGNLSTTSPDYAYLGRIKEVEAHHRDLDYMVERSPYLMIGDPDFLIECFRKLEAMGFDEMLLRIDGLDHKLHRQALEMIGTHVIPAFRTGATDGS